MNKITEHAQQKRAKATLRKLQPQLATIILQAIEDLVDTECPNCLRPLDLPSLEDIQEWLKEEK